MIYRRRYTTDLYQSYLLMTQYSLQPSYHDNFVANIPTVFETLNNWFKRNLLSLNAEKRHYIHFITKNTSSTFRKPVRIKNNSKYYIYKILGCNH